MILLTDKLGRITQMRFNSIEDLIKKHATSNIINWHNVVKIETNNDICSKCGGELNNPYFEHEELPGKKFCCKKCLVKYAINK